MTNREWFNKLTDREMAMRLKDFSILGVCPTEFDFRHYCSLDDAVDEAHEKNNPLSMEEEEQICLRCWDTWFKKEHKAPQTFLGRLLNTSADLTKELMGKHGVKLITIRQWEEEAVEEAEKEKKKEATDNAEF